MLRGEKMYYNYKNWPPSSVSLVASKNKKMVKLILTLKQGNKWILVE